MTDSQNPALTQCIVLFFFLKDPPPPDISPLPLHDALPISARPPGSPRRSRRRAGGGGSPGHSRRSGGSGMGGRTSSSRSDRKSTRLNSSHPSISYAVFCLKKKKNKYLVARARGLRICPTW